MTRNNCKGLCALVALATALAYAQIASAQWRYYSAPNYPQPRLAPQPQRPAPPSSPSGVNSPPQSPRTSAARSQSPRPEAPKPAYTEKAECAKELWSGSWWPTWIDGKENPELPNRLRKYDYLTGAKSAEWQIADVKKQNVVGWAGFCNGWSASAILLDEPKTKKTVKREDRVMELTPGDQKAWLAVACSDIRLFSQIGRRCKDENDKETYDDLTPGELWSGLSEFLGEEKGSVVLDTEAGPPVWNFPVISYEVRLYKTNDPKLYSGVIEVKYADDAVPYEFVGLQTFVRKYAFQIPIVNGAYSLADAKWTGQTAAKREYPDFGWRPLVPRSGNPELSYETVRELLGLRPVAGPNVDEIENLIDDSIPDVEVTNIPELPSPDSPPQTNPPAAPGGETFANQPSQTSQTNLTSQSDHAQSSPQTTVADATATARLNKVADALDGASYDNKILLSTLPGFVTEFEEDEPFSVVVTTKEKGWLVLFSHQNGATKVYYEGEIPTNGAVATDPAKGVPVALGQPYGDVGFYAILFEKKVDVNELGGNMPALEKQALLGYGKLALVVIPKGTGGAAH